MYCTKCGKEISNDALFCKYCGNRVEKIDSAKKVGNTPIKENKKIDVTPIIAVFIALVIYFAGFILVAWQIGGNIISDTIEGLTISDQELIIGTWKDDNETLIFYEDGSFSANGIPGVYSIDDGDFYASYMFSHVEGTYKVTKSSLSITIDGNTDYYEKVY